MIYQTLPYHSSGEGDLAHNTGGDEIYDYLLQQRFRGDAADEIGTLIIGL